MPATHEQIRKILSSDKFTPAEKMYLEFQWGMTGDFFTHLWRAIGHADMHNINRLRVGFPAEVKAYLSWTNGDLADRVREMGVSI